MGTRPGWKALHCYVTEDAHETWHETATEHGFAVSVLIEVLADELDWLLNPKSAHGRRIVESSRKLNGERRRRAGGG